MNKYCKIIESKFYYIKTLDINKYNFVKMFRVRFFSYAGSIFKRLYDFYCKHSVNLHDEYHKYYKNEFDSYNKFLYNKHNLLEEEITIFNHKNSCYKDISNTPETTLESLVQIDELVKNKFYNFFGETNED